jgi:hypothetical protein
VKRMVDRHAEFFQEFQRHACRKRGREEAG